MQGGCLCGAVRYAVEGPPLSTGVCHCETCRRAASAPRLPFVGVLSAGFRFTRGAPVDYPSSPGVTRSFCGKCGSPLTYRRNDAPDELDVMTVSLDDQRRAADVSCLGERGARLGRNRRPVAAISVRSRQRALSCGGGGLQTLETRELIGRQFAIGLSRDIAAPSRLMN